MPQIELTQEVLDEVSDYVDRTIQYTSELTSDQLSRIIAQGLVAAATPTTPENPNRIVAIRLGLLLTLAVEVAYRRRGDANRHN